MRVLWITNIMFPPLCEALGLATPVIGGWMYSSAKRLLAVENSLRMAVATVYSGEAVQKREVEGVVYYLLPLHGKNKQKYHSHLESLWEWVKRDFNPDLVHIHGTEYPHGLAFVKANPEAKTVVSIQGLVSVYARYYLSGLSFEDVMYNITFRDLIRMDNLWQSQLQFAKSGKYEQEILSQVKHIIGRTSWDKAHVCSIHPNVTYHYCNETLRDEFYHHQWNYDYCEQHSIFLSQVGYPIKGFHQVLRALPLVLREYPNTKIYVAGRDIRGNNTLTCLIKRLGYDKFILSLLKELNLEKYIYFTGSLNEKQMCERYLKSNVFICPSSIENSPNSLGEAQLLGMPCITSYVGGVPDMMENYERGLMYRFEEIEMLAESICKVFHCNKYSDNDKIMSVARTRHNAIINANRTIEIYKIIIG